VDLHPGGNIWATSEGEGQGCQFNIDLPLVIAEKDSFFLPRGESIDFQDPLHDKKSLSISPMGSLKNIGQLERARSLEFTRNSNSIILKSPLYVLVVDDSKANRKMLIRMLKMLGHISTEAEDGLAAVKEISLMMRKTGLSNGNDRKGSLVYTQYDVVLMDNCMPRMDGPQASAQMRALGFDRPIIGITGDPVIDLSEFQSAGTYMLTSI
jgi:CheY-like chemotaxis protein